MKIEFLVLNLPYILRYLEKPPKYLLMTNYRSGNLKSNFEMRHNLGHSTIHGQIRTKNPHNIRSKCCNICHSDCTYLHDLGMYFVHHFSDFTDWLSANLYLLCSYHITYRVSYIEMSVFKWFWGVEGSIILLIFL